MRIVSLCAFCALLSCTSEAPPAASRPAPTPTETPRIVEDDPCPPSDPGLGLPPDSGCVSSTAGTFEPNVPAEQLFLYALTDGEGFPTEWHFRLVSEDKVIDRRMFVAHLWGYPVIVGSEDADLDGVDEIFVKLVTHLYHSGATNEVGIYTFGEGRFSRVERDGEQFLFQVGGVSVFGEGAECRDVDADGDAEFLLLRIEGVSNDVQNISTRTYEWRNRELFFVRRKAGKFVKTGYSDPLLFRYYSLRCFTMDPPFPYARG
jgi:hypothetical protein